MNELNKLPTEPSYHTHTLNVMAGRCKEEYITHNL